MSTYSLCARSQDGARKIDRGIDRRNDGTESSNRKSPAHLQTGPPRVEDPRAHGAGGHDEREIRQGQAPEDPGPVWAAAADSAREEELTEESLRWENWYYSNIKSHHPEALPRW